MSHAYRSSYQHIVGGRVAEIKRAFDELSPVLPRLRQVRCARLARIAFGAVGIAGACGMAVGAVSGDDPWPVYLMLAGGAGAFLSYALVRGLRAIGGAFHRATGLELPALSGHLDADLARLEQDSPLRPATDLTERTDRLETYSTALPLVALSLLMPLTLHFLFWSLGGLRERWAHDYDDWIRISLLIVGHAHIALVICSILFARKMRGLDDEKLGMIPMAGEWAKALGVTVLTSSIPGILLLAVPPILTAITGAAFVPLMFVVMRRILVTERAVIESARAAHRVRIVAPDEAMAALEELGSEPIVADAIAQTA